MVTVDWSKAKQEHEEYIQNYPYEDITLTTEQKKAFQEREQKRKRESLLYKIRQRAHYFKYGDIEVKSWDR